MPWVFEVIVFYVEYKVDIKLFTNPPVAALLADVGIADINRCPVPELELVRRNCVAIF